jgi:hypothetical protein
MKKKITVLLSVTLAMGILAAVLISNAALAAEKSNNFAPNNNDATQVTHSEPFFRLPSAQEAALKTIVLNDEQIKSLLESTQFDYQINVGARLVSGLTPEKIRDWVQTDPRDVSFIREYAGVLNIGNNDSYTFSIDINKSSVNQLTKLVKTGPKIPEVTILEKETAKNLVLNNLLIQQLIAGKAFEISEPDGVGLWDCSTTLQKLGLYVTISFNQPYSFEEDLPSVDYNVDKYPFPYYSPTLTHFSGGASQLVVFVNLDLDKIVAITPILVSSAAN